MYLLKKELDTENVHFIKCDVSNEDHVKEAVDEAANKFGTIHTVLSAAGIALFTPFDPQQRLLDSVACKKIIDVNFFGCLWTAKHTAHYISKN
jgi:NAD(P)-dependent dehydrogenase (short-subunit alcohol dehydrogenase family)